MFLDTLGASAAVRTSMTAANTATENFALTTTSTTHGAALTRSKYPLYWYERYRLRQTCQGTTKLHESFDNHGQGRQG